MRLLFGGVAMGAVLSVLGGMAPVEAQQARLLTITGGQNLQFGTLLPGLQTTVRWNDAVNGGQFDIRGIGGAEVRVELTLPISLTLPTGVALPVLFGAGDAGYASQPSLGAATPFDPRLPLITPLAKSGRLYLWLGGTATPSSTQTPGQYRGTISVTVSYTGV